MTYTVQVPGALATKATGGYELIYEVYREAEVGTASAAPIYEGTETFSGNSVDLPLEFVKGQDFVVLFWAQKEGCSAYTTGNLRTVTLANGLNANDENAEAFAGNDVVENCASKVGGNVTLVRPIAQLNIATLTSGLKLGEGTNAANVDPGKIRVAVAGLYNTYNVANNTASGTLSTDDAPVSYAEADAPKTEFNTDYTLVGSTYVGFIPSTGATVNVDFTINAGPDGNINHKVSNVPVKANYKTNIIGNLITATDNYQVNLGAWVTEEENIEVVATANQLQEAINNTPDGVEGYIQLEGDIELGSLAGLFSTKAAAPEYGLVIPVSKTIVLDLNGKTLSQELEQTAAYALIKNLGNLTIIDKKGNGKITYGDKGNGGNYGSNTILNNGKLTIESGLIENNSSDNAYTNGYPHPIDNNGELIINGGTLTNNGKYSSIRIWCTTDDNTSVTINGGTFNGSIDFQTPSAAANKGILTINGGTFIADTYTNSAVRLLGFGADVDEMFGYINGGTFNGSVKINKYGAVQELNSQVFYITGGQFSVDPSAFVVDGYPVVAPETEGGYYTIGQYTPVAMIGDKDYGSLRAAVAAAQDGETITLIENIEQRDGVIITDKKLTIDLNDKTFTVTEGASTNNRNFKINGSSVVTIKNGIMVAAGEYSSGAYGTVRTEGTANVTLTDVKLYNYRGNGLNVKALSGTTVTISDTEVYSQYGGGIESAGGTIELTNVKIEQKGMYTAPYNSMAISVNGGGTVTVNSGTYSTECITAEEANNQGTSHGPWCAGVLNSGGTLIINGGTFSNDNFGENSLATYARGLLLADTGANIQINGGTFNALKAIVDVTNNLGDASRNPSVTLVGGNFSADPRISGLYASDLISVAEGKVVKEKNNRYQVEDFVAVAKVGNTEYGSIDDAIAAWTNNTTLTLLTDVTLSEVVTLKSTEHHILNLGTYTMTAASGKNAIEIVPEGDGAGTAARSCLTINADTANPGTMEAGSKACVYYKKTNGINDRIMVTFNGGIFNGTISSSSNNGGQACPYFVFNGGVFNKSINLTKAMLKVTGGIFHSMFSCTGDSTAHRLISGGTFKSWTFMTADAENKFCVGTDKQTYNVGLYINDDGYLVVGGPVITEFGDKFAAKATNATKWSSYLQYSSAAANGLYYTNAEAAIKKHGAANVVLK